MRRLVSQKSTSEFNMPSSIEVKMAAGKKMYKLFSQNGKINLDAVVFENFRSFESTGELPVRPITIVFGPNSSGKSSLLKGIYAIHKTLQDESGLLPFVTQSKNFTDLGHYTDYVYQKDCKKHLTLGIKANWQGIPVSITVTLGYLQTSTRIVVLSFELQDDKNHITLLREGLNPQAKLVCKSLSNSNMDKYVRWRGFSPEILVSSLEQSQPHGRKGALSAYRNNREGFLNVAESFEWMRLGLGALFSSLKYIGPLRQEPQRNYQYLGEKPQGVGLSGEFMHILLYQDESLRESVSKHLKQAFGYSLELKNKQYGRQLELYLKNESGQEYNLMDTGFGISQLLPILTECLLDRQKQQIIMMEQPEIHLHPKAQAELMSLLVSLVAGETRKQIIVETHSEAFLLRLQRSIVEKKISCEDVVAWYVDMTQTGSQVHVIRFDEKGQMINPPDTFTNFFSGDYEDIMETMQILARGQKGK